jgi:hypothetical protein
MGDILYFERPRKDVANRPPPPGGAEILFFVGVRYERWEEPQPLAAPPKAPRRRRKTLKGCKRKRRAQTNLQAELDGVLIS